jgi:hypothetical protein
MQLIDEYEYSHRLVQVKSVCSHCSPDLDLNLTFIRFRLHIKTNRYSFPDKVITTHWKCSIH